MSDVRATPSAPPMVILNSYQGRSRFKRRLFERNWILTPSQLKPAIANPLIRHPVSRRNAATPTLAMGRANVQSP
ncbi:hypothetical protein N9301_08175 [Paracoccaceae bacterium]|nr:hypothetical protein [Paracoccaceae bacterium]